MKAFPKHYQNSDALQVKFFGWGQDSQKREIHLYMFAIWEKFPNNPVFFSASVYTGCSKLYKWMGWTSSMSTALRC